MKTFLESFIGAFIVVACIMLLAAVSVTVLLVLVIAWGWVISFFSGWLFFVVNAFLLCSLMALIVAVAEAINGEEG